MGNNNTHKMDLELRMAVSKALKLILGIAALIAEAARKSSKEKDKVEEGD